MEKGQVYLIGADTLFNVLEINTIQQDKNNNNKYDISDDDEFLTYMA